MDEVFGNSSTETVVSAQELSNASFDESIISDEEQSAEAVNEESPKEVVETFEINTKETDRLNKNEDSQFFNEPVNKSIRPLNQKASDHLFKMPFPPLAPLRHTQSEIVQRPAAILTRTRAHSTSEAVQRKYNPYQNIPLNIQSFSPKYPSYVNLPGTIIESFNRTSSLSELSLISSAPSTPRGSHISKVKKSYIQLWTGSEESVFSNDDTISSCSGAGYVSMTSPYLSSPNSSILSNMAFHLSHYGTKAGTTELFCSFCARPFTKEINLKNHIQAIHRHDLQKVINSKEPVTLQFCPGCQSRFFNSDLLPNHLLEFHREVALEILDRSKSLKFSEKEMKCPFCAKKVCLSKSGEENMLNHVAQLHCTEFHTLILSLFTPIECLKKGETLAKLSTEDLARVLSFQPAVTSTPGLSLKFKSLTCEHEENSINGSHTNLEETWNSHCGVRIEDKVESATAVDQHQIICKGILRSRPDLTRKPSVKRELRFSVPPVTSAEFFIPESPESTTEETFEDIETKENIHNFSKNREIPIRVDSLSSADFIELTSLPSRKRRRLGVSLKSKSSIKKKKCETTHLVENVFEGLKSIGCGKNTKADVITTTATRSFRKPKPVPPPKIPSSKNIEKSSSVPAPPSEVRMSLEDFESEFIGPSPFGNLKLYSPLKMFRCNGCRIKYCDNESLGCHIRTKHKGFMGLIRPHFGCGICSAKFFENKYLVKHCLQHHTSLLEIRSPKKHKISVYRFKQD